GMFIGREYEINEMNRLYDSDKFQMPVIYGRRRVGKSTLIRQFIQGKRAVVFTAAESTAEKNLQLFSQSIYAALLPQMQSLPAFADFEAAFEFLHEQSKDERLIVVIDEYPYLAAADKSISSRLQKYIDEKFQNGKLFLILCGSSMSFMENQVLGYQSPLYGRRTAQFKILPFDYQTSALFVPEYTAQERALVYAVTGGIPKYLELFEPEIDVHENIIRLFFNNSGYLYEEPANLMKQEMRDASNYNAVIEALACGANRINELVGKTHLDAATVSYCLKSLISLGIVEKESAMMEEDNKKKTHYIVADGMFCFWYRFVLNGTEMILLKQGAEYYDEVVKPQLSDFMGRVFERMCRNFIMNKSSDKIVPFQVMKTGRWWGNNPKLRREEEIDLVAVNLLQKRMLIGECKYRKEKMDLPAVELLMERGELVPGGFLKTYILFSKSGFEEEVRQMAKERGIVLVTLEDMYPE
ncbi:MAG: ATP-binding protein, partial [Eubacterium sp.]|nr:ATP-binding protein [Eubacterium sp.]